MKKTMQITRTAVLIAILIALQYVTKPAGQFVTGSCVNLVLGVAALVGGLWSGVTVAVLSPFFAFLLGIGTPMLPLVPAIALGNLVYVLALTLLTRKLLSGRAAMYGAVVLAAAAKFLTLFLVIVKLLLPALGLADKQVTALTASFSWPQLVTALIGGALAATIVPLLKRAVK